MKHSHFSMTSRSLTALMINLFAALPLLAAQPASPQPARACANLETQQGMALALMLPVHFTCRRVDAAYDRRSAEDFRVWRAQMERCANPNLDQLLVSAEKAAESQLASVSATARAQMLTDCGKQEYAAESLFRAPSAKYATPESTWEEFKAALKAKDAPRALRCFADPAPQYLDFFSGMPAADLPKLAAVYGRAVRLKDGETGNYIQVAIEPAVPDGKTVVGTAVFVRINGNWLIEML